LRVPACIKLRPGQSLADAARAGLGLRRPFQKFGRRGGASPAQQVEPPTVPRVTVASRALLPATSSSWLFARLAFHGRRTGWGLL
jgi:hypothetical protein